MTHRRTCSQTFPEVRETYRRRFRHVLVDEYQDTNHAQYALIHQLCADSLEEPTRGEPAGAPSGCAPAELMVVGDADQSIYAFRGANIRNILDFEQDFPNATSILLEQNYRSTQTILNAANAVIGHNQGRKPKNLWSDAGDGEQIVGYVADDEHDEARFVSERDRHAHRRAASRPGDVAVFYRTNAQSRVFEEVFIRLGMPYKVVGGVRFYERREVRDALAYLRMLVNPADEVSLRRILNVPKRGIGDRAGRVRRRRCAAARADHLLGGAAPRRRGARAGHPVADGDPAASSPWSRSSSRWSTRASGPTSCSSRCWPAPATSTSSRPPTTRRTRPGVENLAELVAVAREFADDPVAGPSADPADVDAGTVTPGPARLPRAGRAGRRHRPDPRRARRRRRGVVTLMTLHTAKGLEFPVVFLTGLEDGVFPHSRSLGDQPELEEERRLAYVGVTRARERLYVSRARGPLGLGRARAQPGLPLPRRAARSTSSTGAAPRPAQTRWQPSRPLPSTAPAGRADRRRPPQLHRRRRPRRRRRQGQAGPRDPRRSSPATGCCTTRSGWAPSSPSRASADKAGRLDRLRLRGRQAAAAAVRAGREAVAPTESASEVAGYGF